MCIHNQPSSSLLLSSQIANHDYEHRHLQETTYSQKQIKEEGNLQEALA
jgi:hypothetical protein